MAKLTPAKSKKKADKWFSLWVRMKDADSNGMVSCFTCGCRKHWKNMHAGHYIPRNILTTRWDERNVRPQCPGCNLFGGGKPDIFAIELMALYSKDILQELHNLRNSIRPMKQFEFEEIAMEYKLKVESLKKALKNEAL